MAKNFQPHQYLRRYLIALAIIWTALIAFSIFWNFKQARKEVLSMAKAAAVHAFQKDVLYRRWAASHGGVYVPVNKLTPPNPYLSNIPERDVVTSSGRRLTLINPASMSREVYDMAKVQYGQYGFQSHITSLRPLRPENAPGPWERKALKQFARGGRTEVFSVIHRHGSSFLRYMHVLKVKQGCLKCHAAQGYKVGDTRGGISISVPLKEFYDIQAWQYRPFIAFHLLIWLVGIAALLLGGSKMVKLLSRQEEMAGKLLESEERFRRLLEYAPVPMAMINHDGAIDFINQKIVSTFGYRRQDIPSLDKFWFRVCPDADDRRQSIGRWQSLVDEARAGNREIKEAEYHLTCLDGSRRIVKIYGTVLEDVSILVFNDITRVVEAEKEKKYLEEQLRQAQKMEAIGTLAGGIAHDFNNILTAILGFTSLAIDEKNSGGELESYLQEVMAASNRARELVKQILTFSRQHEQQLQPLRIQFVCREALKFLRSTIPSTVEIKQNIEAQCPPVLADPTQIYQVIINLCTNGYHAMRDGGGTLVVSLDTVEGMEYELARKFHLEQGLFVRLTVADTGPGIPRDIRERIFEPYFTTKVQGEGTGLGLAVVHGVVTRCHGAVKVESTLGRGTTFFVYLPVLPEEYIVGAEESTVEPAAEVELTGDERILLAEDNPGVLKLQEKILSNLGYEVVGCRDGLQALELFRQNPDQFDLLCTDMTMPRMTGAELAAAVLKIKPTMPVVLCTGFSELINEEKAREIGIARYLMKPVSRELLAQTIRNALDG